MGRRLYVGNLSYNTTELELREVFGQYGTVADAKVVTERETGRPRGFAFVEMSTEQEAKTAIEELSGRELGGRALNVNEAQERSSGGGGGRSFGGGGRRRRRWWWWWRPGSLVTNTIAATGATPAGNHRGYPVSVAAFAFPPQPGG